MKKHRVIFQPAGRRGEIEEGKTLLEAAQALGVDIEGLCGSKKVCGKCKVRIEEGYFEKDNIESGMKHLSPITEAEKKHIKPEDGPGIRLACTAEIHGDIKIFVPERSRAGKQVVRKAAKELSIKLDPAVKKYNVELTPPTLHDMTVGDYERVLQFLQDDYGLTGLSCDFIVLRDLQNILRAGGWKATVTVWMDQEIIKVEPGFVEMSYGLAVDIGTTTCVGYLTDLGTGNVVNTESIMNPQVPYGEDVMSRITYAMSNPDGLEIMQKAIISGLNDIIERVVSEIIKDGPPTHPSPSRGRAREGGFVIDDMTIVFNTAMHHIFLGLNPEYIGRSPFIPAVQKSLDIKARDLSIKINPAAYIHVLPIEAGFVGADNVGVLIAEEPYKQDEMVLIIDIGTNGELLMGNRNKVCSTSCATGPAFEGAQIKFGMRAAPGAIETVLIDPVTKEPRYKVIGKADWHTHMEKVNAKGLCGSGIIGIVAELFKAGIIDKSGRFVMDLGTRRVRKGVDGKPEYVLAWADETSIGTDITVTQADVRALQLAKGALYTGAKLMMKKLGITKLDRVVLAGAFGSHIDKEASLTLGMFPDCPIDKVYAVGNAAGDGARMALINKSKRTEADEKARWVEFLEIATDPAFEREFMQAMHIPHMKDLFPNLKTMLEKSGSKVEIKG
ncbi:MAG: ferredoxin [Nitrospirae bacterium CG_4_10_14_3_um_filter_44_29]|nr:MAG: ferredoxin [Nitrospirae bacterium CG22_combo_CG10-13_8_21_14_all_44_11]PIV40924.1 MAG: ferredoxin [Nitrospirae bacterium CG02_land_8_20_14_3_00_44_33]PIX87960.1 MAG: ferredoxin [Nitrospirae bacterium CG_4_10_14_3_um_filter_44_29]